jgi:hypothetical protein
MSAEPIGFDAQNRDSGCASVLVCRADALVTEALTSVLIGLQSVQAHRQAITPMLGGQIERLSRNDSDAARLAIMILSQFSPHPA